MPSEASTPARSPTPTPTCGAVIFAKDIQRVAAFYRRLLHLEVLHEGPDHVVIESPRAALVIHGIPAAIAKKIQITDPPQLREETAQKLFFVVESLADCREAAKALGGGVHPKRREWSARNFTACDGFDPEGNVFQLREVQRVPPDMAAPMSAS